jgi:hypothetical protein
VYQGIIDLNVEGKVTEKFHHFKRGEASVSGIINEYFTIDTMELRYIFLSFRAAPGGYDAWYYFLPGFGY